MRTIVAASLTSLFVISAAAHAQDQAPLKQPEFIPYQLASALISAGPIGYDPQILVGSMPEWVSNKIVMPANAHVLGAAFIGTTAVAILALPPDADSVIPDMRREMMKRGWKIPPNPSVGSGGGFRAAPPSQVVEARRAVLCNDLFMVTATSMQSRGVVTEVTVRLTTVSQTGYSACHPVFPQQAQMSAANRPNLPLLYNPAGAEASSPTSDCLNTRYLGPSSYTTLRTSMSADAVLDHYSRQLQDSGWKPLPARAPTLVRSWTRPDSTGTLIETQLSVAQMGGSSVCQDVGLSVYPARKP
jgi:hypothetical protein